MSQGTHGGSGAPDQSADGLHAQHAWDPESSSPEPSQYSQPPQGQPSTSTAPLGLSNLAIDGHSAAASPAPTIFYTPLHSPPPSPEHLLSPSVPYSPTPRRAQPHSSYDHIGLGLRMEGGENPAGRSQDHPNLSNFPVHGREGVGAGAYHPAHPTGDGEKWAIVPPDPSLHQGRESKKPKAHNPGHIPPSQPSFASTMVGHSASFLHNLSQLLNIIREKGQKTTNQGAISYVVGLLSNTDYKNVPGLLQRDDDTKNLMEFLLFLLDNNSLNNTGFEEANYRARRLLMQLGMEKVIIPDSLIIDPSKITKNGEAFDFGGYADVYSGRYYDEHVALKMIRSSNINKDLIREVLAWRTLSHKYLLPFIGVYIDPSRRFVHLVSPLMVNGTLSNWRNRSGIAVSDIQNHMLCVAEGLQYLHWKGMIHGDIRGTNILLDHNFQVKIADFGLARHSDGTGTNNEAMSAPFTAPELFCETGELKRTKKTDVYAFGCLFYEIHFGRLPFVGGVFKIAEGVKRGQRPRKLNEPPLDGEAWNLIERCWHMEPTQRPSMDDAVQDMEFWYRSYPLSPPLSS